MAIKKFKDHYIICGAGTTTTGIHTIKELYDSKKDFVVIHGDATVDETLIEAGIKKAKAIACVLSLDKDNLFLTLTARHLNPKIRIISRMQNLENKRKLIRAGANSVVPPQFIGALRVVSELIRPTVVGFLDTMLKDKENFRVEEIEIPENSWIIGKNLADLDISKKIGPQIIAIKHKDAEKINYYPQATDILETGTVLITIADPDKYQKIINYISWIQQFAHKLSTGM